MDDMRLNIKGEKKKTALKLSDEKNILEYLVANPSFFIRYPQILDQIVLPHPVKGTISLLEAQQKRLKESVKSLKESMYHMSEIASFNDSVFRTFFNMYNDLYQCQSINEMVMLLNETCREKLFVPYSRIWINANKVDNPMKCDQKYLISLDNFSIVCEHFMHNEMCDLGKLTDAERVMLFEDSDLIYSRLMIRLGVNGDLGVLVFGHADISHYHKDLECSFIQQLAGFITLLIPRFVRIK